MVSIYDVKTFGVDQHSILGVCGTLKRKQRDLIDLENSRLSAVGGMIDEAAFM